MRFIVFIFVFLINGAVLAQVGSPYRQYGTRGAPVVPRTNERPMEDPEALTAEERVDQQMPKILEVLELNPFEEAVLRSILTKYVQKRIELQILALDPDKNREALEKMQLEQDEELKQSLPPEQYEALQDLYKNNGKVKKKKKKKKSKS
ncbi:MAG: hypothetical protein OEQ81_11225 [Flavobacteriaceae bacterium]|nr:hypothetical protein [Flavobacteriaceae bacterium]